jgi:hypothetical protein
MNPPGEKGMIGFRPFPLILACALCRGASGGSSESLNFSKINPDRLPFHFEVHRIIGNVSQSIPAYLDDDAVDEIISRIQGSPTETALNAIEVDGIGPDEVAFRRNFQGPVELSPMAADVEDRDGKKEIFVQETGTDGVLLHVLDWRGGTAMSL